MKNLIAKIGLYSMGAALLLTSCTQEQEATVEEAPLKSVSAKTRIANFQIPTLKKDIAFKNLHRDINASMYNVVEPSECGDTPFDEAISASIASNIDALGVEYYSWMAEINFIYSLTDNGVNYFGDRGEYTYIMKNYIRSLEDFWDMPREVSVRGQHRRIFKNRNKLVKVLDEWYTFSNGYTAELAADEIIAVSKLSTFVPETPFVVLDGFAIALEGQLGQHDVVVIGDGILEMGEASGVKMEAVIGSIVAHEWAHQIQFNNFDDWYPNGAADNIPEATRTTELEADFFTGYYLMHQEGYLNDWDAAQEFLQMFYNIGDCSFTSDGHHGTPLQRMAAAEKGAKVALNTQSKGKILTAQQVHKRFLNRLPAIVAVP